MLLPLVLGPHWGSLSECVKVKGTPLWVGRTFRKQMRIERERNKREINREEKMCPLALSHCTQLMATLLFYP